MSSDQELPDQRDDQAQPPNLSISLGSLVGTNSNPTKTDLSAAQLEQALRHEADERKTERFFWISGVTVLFDAVVGLTSLKVVAILVPFELITLIGLANWLEVEFVKRPLQQFFDTVLRKNKKM